MSRKPLVHWTVHSCLAAGLRFGAAVGYAGQAHALGSDVWKAWLSDPLLVYVSHTGCSRRRRKRLPDSDSYSTQIGDVTCAWCVDRYDEVVRLWARDAAARRSSSEGQPIAALIRAHDLCCAKRGAPLMADSGEAEAYQRRTRWELAEARWTVAAAATSLGGGAGLRDGAADMLARLGEAGRLAVAELLLAAEWMEQAKEAIARGRAMFEQLREQIESGEIDGRWTEAPRASGTAELLRRAAREIERQESEAA